MNERAGITRDDTVHGETYYTRAQVDAEIAAALAARVMQAAGANTQRPTDEEIDALYEVHKLQTGGQRNLIRAALAKWGAPQAQPLAQPLTPAQMVAGRDAIFSTSNPYCLATSGTLNHELTLEIEKLRVAISKFHAAKGRYHTQIAVCDLFESVGLSGIRPDCKQPSIRSMEQAKSKVLQERK